jgi:arylsulfatase A-like enzyme
MEVYAAQVELLDAGVGKVVAALKETGAFDDTVVMFMSDNGGCAEKTGRTETAAKVKGRVLGKEEVQTQIRPAYARDGREVKDGPAVTPGGPATFVAYGQGWANVSNTPFKEYKHWVHEGGISSPLVVSWPSGVKRHGEWEGQPGCVEDVMATCVELAGAKGPARTEGVSLVPAFRGEKVERANPIFWEHEGNRAVREGKWKLVAKGEKGAWELYDIEADRGETRDLAEKETDRVTEMAAAWQAWAERSQVLPMRPYAKKGAGAAE